MQESDVVVSKSDNCTIASTTLSQTAFDCSDIGDNTVTVTVTDASGNSISRTVTVTVVDISNQSYSPGCHLYIWMPLAIVTLQESDVGRIPERPLFDRPGTTLKPRTWF